MGDKMGSRGGAEGAEWKECKISDIGKVLTGKTPSKDNPEDWGDDLLFITPSDYGNYNKKAKFSIRNLSHIGAKRQFNRILPPNSILVTCIGSDMGKSVMNTLPCITNQQINSIIPDNKIADNNYVYYITISLHDVLRTMGGDGTAVPILNKTDFENLDILLPPLPEQRAIAGVLSSLDDKIDLLHRQNKTLEAMAEALFRQWFGDSEKRTMNNEKWEERKLPEEFEFTMGQSPAGTSFNEDKIGTPMFQGNADFGFRFPAERVYTTEPTRFAEPLNTLVSVRAPVGEQNMALVKCCIGRGVAAFRYKKIKDYYTYTYFKIRSLMTEIKQFNDEGTVFGSIGKADFESLDITIPPFFLIESYEQNVRPINDKVIENCNQIRTLEKLRDTLLPKLMSGEVRVEVNE